MKVTKSIILSAVAALIVAAGPEAAAPLVGVDVAANAQTRPLVPCKAGFERKTRSRAIPAVTVKYAADGVTVVRKAVPAKTITVSRCVKKAVKAPLKCKAPKVPVEKTVNTTIKNADGTKTAGRKTITICGKPKPTKRAIQCKTGTVSKDVTINVAKYTKNADGTTTKTIVPKTIKKCVAKKN